MLEYLRVGKIANTHGLKGEIKVIPTTDDVARFEDLTRAYIDTGRGRLEVEVTSVRYQPRFVLLKLKGYDDIDAVLPFKNRDLLVHREDAIELDENENFVGDLIGCEVVEDERVIGTVKDVLFTGANDVYVVKKPDGKELLIPVIPQCVLDVDVEHEVIRVKLLEGLEEL